MAIIHCHDCKNEVSDAALNCPYCGYPIRAFDFALSKHRESAIKSFTSQGGLFALNPPLILIQICPATSITNNAEYPQFVERCSQLNTLFFHGDSPAVPHRISTGVFMRHPYNVSAGAANAFINVEENGIVNIGDSYSFDRGNSKAPVFFAFDFFLHDLKMQLGRFVNIYSETKVPEPYWLQISFLGIANTHLGSSVFRFPDIENGTAIELDFRIKPIELRRDDVNQDGVYLSIGNAIWHGYGKPSCPIELVQRIFAEK